MHRKSVTNAALKDVYQLNYLLTGFVFLCSFIFLLLFENRWVTVVMVIKSAGYIFTVSFILIHILRYCANRYSHKLVMFRISRYGLSYGIGITLYLIFWHLFASLAGIWSRSNGVNWIVAYMLVAVIIITIILLLQDFTILRRTKIEIDLENSRLQIRSAEAENLLLKQHIQPHFLFNALNTLKALIKSNPQFGEQYLIQLADFLRASVSQNKKFTATFQEELLVCINYLEMQKIRFGDSLLWEINVDDDSSLNYYIPSFSLQPLLENAIKHNALSKDKPLKIILRQQSDRVEVLNNINAKEYGDISTKSGLGNLAERYFLLTGDEIKIVNDGRVFSVSFKLSKNESNHH